VPVPVGRVAVTPSTSVMAFRSGRPRAPGHRLRGIDNIRDPRPRCGAGSGGQLDDRLKNATTSCCVSVRSIIVRAGVRTRGAANRSIARHLAALSLRFDRQQLDLEPNANLVSAPRARISGVRRGRSPPHPDARCGVAYRRLAIAARRPS
jgi:hypothetical protein